MVRFWRERHASLALERPVRVLVLTFNRTLRGYIAALTRQQIPSGEDVEIEVTTFGAWAQQLLNRVVLEREPRDGKILRLAAAGFPWTPAFLLSEVDYALGRFLPADLDSYVARERTGRGLRPRVDRDARRWLLDGVIYPYRDWKAARSVVDWNDLAVALAEHRATNPYEVVVVDETQDFSANQVRAIASHLAEDFVCTFIRDSTQRIYPNFFNWSEVDVEIPQSRRRILGRNHRNTRQIAAFARPLVDHIESAEDGSLPDFTGCMRDGPRPVVLRGRYGAQLAWAIAYLRSGRVGPDETVAFLHPLGGGWFRELRTQLDAEGIPWTSLTREADWPDGTEQVALSTMHSAKGLEFDHVVLLGYNAQVVPHGEEAGDSLLETHCRLLAMAVGRARHSVLLGYKPEDASQVVDFLDHATYEAIDV